MHVLKLNSLITNRLLYSWLKGIGSHDDILILISIACLITSLDRGKWQYTAFRAGIKNFTSKYLNDLGLFSVSTFFFNSDKLLFNSEIALYRSYVLRF